MAPPPVDKVACDAIHISSMFRIKAASSTISNDNASERAPVDALDIALI